MTCKTILNENKAYWTQRASGYSEVNQAELGTAQHEIWRGELCRQIAAHFPDRAPEDLRVLDVGTGPGFFAILLTESGFRVTAIDLTPEMLSEARRNAGAIAEQIDFFEMNAEATTFPDGAFDVIVTRNLTWNLPHPEQALREWARLLAPGGLLLNFDANWYGYLFDEDKRADFDADRLNSAAQGVGDQNVGEKLRRHGGHRAAHSSLRHAAPGVGSRRFHSAGTQRAGGRAGMGARLVAGGEDQFCLHAAVSGSGFKIRIIFSLQIKRSVLSYHGFRP